MDLQGYGKMIGDAIYGLMALAVILFLIVVGLLITVGALIYVHWFKSPSPKVPPVATPAVIARR